MSSFNFKYFAVGLLTYIKYTVVFYLLAMSSSCDGRSNQLNNILANPLADLTLSTATETARVVRDKGKVLGKPVRAKTSIQYTPVTEHSTDEVFNEIIEMIKEQNWQLFEQIDNQPGYFKALLPQGELSIVIEILAQIDKNTVTVLMEHRAP